MRGSLNYSDTYYSAQRRRDRKKKILVYVLSFVCIGLIVGGVLGWYFKKNSNQVNNDAKNHKCPDLPDSMKFDCYPDAPVNEKECLNRGCCFSKPENVFNISSLPPLNVPYCYYPSDYVGYTVEKVEKSERRIKIKLHRSQPSGFVKDASNVNVQVLFIDDSTLRIKITDNDSERFEVPTQLYYRTKKLTNTLYSVNVDQEYGLLTVNRKNGTTVFKTNLLQLVFSDQLLQLSSLLPTSNIYGLGEHYEGVLRSVNWSRFTMINSDLSPIADHGLYGTHPFYMAFENFGRANGVFLYNSNIMDVILQPSPAITYRTLGGILDFFIMLGPSPNDVARQYSNIVGKTFMPPYWSLGFHLCRYGYNSLNKTKEIMTRNINAGIPLDVQWNDIDYMDTFKDFTYDKENFEGLPKFIDDLHSKGMHYVIIIDPGISNSEKTPYIPYEEGLDDDIFVKNANGSILVGKVWTDGTTVYPDFSHPAAVSYWTRQFTRLYEDIKFDGIWIDMNEPSNFYNGAEDGCPDSPLENPQYIPGGNPLITKTLCMSAKHYYTTHYNEHNLYAYREAVATNKALRSIVKKRPFIISRASFAGQGVYSGHWSGDIFSTWENMRYSIRSLINFNMYAMPMIGSDICGFGGNTTQELCARWQALGAFYPFSRNHNDKSTIEQDPVALGQQVIQATRTALMKRYTLLPYLYTLFYRSHAFGDTVIRPLFFEFPKDENTYAIDEQFLWGSNMMIVQVLYPGASSVNAYFPKGLWYDAVTGNQSTSEGENFNLTIPVTEIYLSLRGGFITPVQIPALTTTEARKNPFTLAVAFDEQIRADGELYWDDGESLETYENEFYNLIEFHAYNGTLNSTVLNSGYQTSMNLQSINIVGLPKIPLNVTVNGDICIHDDPSSNKTESDPNYAEKKSEGILGIDFIKPLSDKESFTCKFYSLGSVFIIQTKPISLLDPLVATWE